MAQEELRELAKRRGFFFQSQESYGGAAGFYTYGPEGASIKSRIEEAWRDRFKRKEGNIEIDAPTVMREPVFEASGHLEGFDDMIIECPGCGKSIRADHLVEDGTRIDEAESFSTDEIMDLIREKDLACPSCREELAGEPVDDFNLMFQTSIGPGSSNPGYLRPETAQGIFVEFPRLKEYARNRLPFGVTQIGRAYRNEISPRNALVRTREFTQAELEKFVFEDQSPELGKVSDVELRLLSSESQEEDGSVREMTVGEAVEKDVITSDWVAYYLGAAQRWFERVGVEPDRLRFRQHQSGELAHYASDCWDAETEIGEDGEDWLEVAGFAFRGCYDLKKHDEHSDDDYTVFREFDEPKTVEEASVSPDMGWLGPEFGDQAGEIREELQRLAQESPEAFESENVVIELEEETVEIPAEKAGFSVEEVEKHGENVFPQVAEPSFGIDRIVYSVLVHSMETDEVDGEERQVLKLPSETAPADVAVLPLMDKDGLGEKASKVASELREAGLSVRYDSSGSIGRRYRRQDEIGTPVCVTIDYESLEDDSATLRDRDTTEQERIDLDGLEEAVEERKES